MPIINDESTVKQPSQFLKYEVGDGGNELMLLSHLYKIDVHFLPSAKRSVVCKGEECFYCKQGIAKRSEYNYLLNLNGEVGVMDIKPSVFYNIQGISKAQKKDPRQISWTIVKTGEGLNTEYMTSKNDNLSVEDFKKVTEELDANTDKLSILMKAKEKQLEENYNQNQEVNPDDVPAEI